MSAIFSKSDNFLEQMRKEKIAMEELLKENKDKQTTKALEREFQQMIRKPFPVSISLDAPSITFTISDLEQDPMKYEDQFRGYLAQLFMEEVTISFKRGNSSLNQMINSQQLVQLPAKIKWNMAVITSQEANNTWTATIKVPLI